MKKTLALVAILLTSVGAFVEWWRRHPRFGAATVNRVVNPWLMRQGIAETTHGEIALLEHVGRSTGTVRVTPVHPVPTADGFRIIVPLGVESQWARNVLAAGHCRLQIGDTVHELDEPKLVEPSEVDEVPTMAASAMGWLGFCYLRLHQFAEHPGSLEEREVEARPTEAVAVPVEPDAVAAEPEVVPLA